MQTRANLTTNPQGGAVVMTQQQVLANAEAHLNDLRGQMRDLVDSMVEPNDSYQPDEAVNVLLTHWLETAKPDLNDSGQLDLVRSVLYTIKCITCLTGLNLKHIDAYCEVCRLEKEVRGE